jgi:hypothetical protein
LQRFKVWIRHCVDYPARCWSGAPCRAALDVRICQSRVWTFARSICIDFCESSSPPEQKKKPARLARGFEGAASGGPDPNRRYCYCYCAERRGARYTPLIKLYISKLAAQTPFARPELMRNAGVASSPMTAEFVPECQTRTLIRLNGCQLHSVEAVMSARLFSLRRVVSTAAARRLSRILTWCIWWNRLGHDSLDKCQRPASYGRHNGAQFSWKNELSIKGQHGHDASSISLGLGSFNRRLAEYPATLHSVRHLSSR